MGIWEVSPVLISLNGHELRYYSLFFSAMLVIGHFIFNWQMELGGYSYTITDFFFLAVVVVVGSRLGHVAFYEPAFFLSNPGEILNSQRGGLASHGTAIALLLALWWIAHRESARYIDILDRFSIPVTVGIVFVRLGNFFNSEIIGRVTDVSWGLKFPYSSIDNHLPLDQIPYRHPVQLYEAGIGLLVMFLLLLINHRLGENRPKGLMAAVLLVVYFGGRFLVEFFKEYQVFNSADSLLTMGQYLSLPLVLIGLILLQRSMKHLKTANQKSA